jgi:high-affinity iron transporter
MRIPAFIVSLVTLVASLGNSAVAQTARDGHALDEWADAIDRAVIDTYGGAEAVPLPPPPAVIGEWRSAAAKALLEPASRGADEPFVVGAGRLRARAQQALVLEMTAAVRAGDVPRAQFWRARLIKPRGSSSAEGALLLRSLPNGDAQRADAARALAREAIAWQTSRARQLMAEGVRDARGSQPMPGRLAERFAEAMTLADLPPALRDVAAIEKASTLDLPDLSRRVAGLPTVAWGEPATHAATLLQRSIQTALPSVLTADERSRRERLVLKLVALVPREYAAGVRDGEVTVPLEYRESVAFTAQARQMAAELAPLWLAQGPAEDAAHEAVTQLDEQLQTAEGLIARKAPPTEVEAALKEARDTLEGPLGVSLRRAGSTAEIVEEVLLETRALLNNSLACALAGRWAQAEQFRLEAYTTFDPDLEARLMPRDPQLAMDIERLLLDGTDHPGVKMLLDRHAAGPELEAAYARVSEAMDRAGALLKTGVDPMAAALNAGSIVLREGLEGLLVIVAIFAGLRGAENARRRRLFWVGCGLSMLATAVTWALSRTIITSLHSYAEVIAAVTGILAIIILLLITNWLFQQVYWKQWVTTLKSQAQEGESVWQLMSVGFLVGYREGFETVLFLQSLMIEAGGKSVSIGVVVGCAVLLVLGIAALKVGLKLPYYQILLVTAVMIGVVLITFVGGTVRAAQTVGWLPVHRFTPGSWPNWMGNWLGLYNTWESVSVQLLTALIVLGTWRVARWNAKRASAQKRRERTGSLIGTPSPA